MKTRQEYLSAFHDAAEKQGLVLVRDYYTKPVIADHWYNNIPRTFRHLRAGALFPPEIAAIVDSDDRIGEPKESMELLVGHKRTLRQYDELTLTLLDKRFRGRVEDIAYEMGNHLGYKIPIYDGTGMSKENLGVLIREITPHNVLSITVAGHNIQPHEKQPIRSGRVINF